MKSDDQLTDAELKSKLSEVSSDLRKQADDDAAALTVNQDSYTSDLQTAAAAEVVAAAPSMAGIDQPSGLAAGALDSGTTNFERAFNSAQQDALSAVAAGVDQFVAMVLQEAVDTIDELRNLTDEVGVEAAQIALAAASGYLTPPSAMDVEDYQDEVGTAKSQATLVQREVQNLQARRQASRVAAGTEAQPDVSTAVRNVGARALVRTQSASEPTDRDDQGATLAAGTPGQTQSAIAADQNERLQALLRAPALTRISYIAVCAAIDSMTRTKDARTKASTTIDKLKSVYAAIKNILSGNFLNDLQENLENQANKAVGNAVGFLQDKLDAADGFLAAIAKLPGPFVSTVSAIGDQPDRSPVVDSISALCGLKSAKFCDLQGLIEVANSLDREFGLKMPTPPMFGRAQFTLDAPEESQAPHHVTVPGQEADLILVSYSPTQVVARFSRQLAPVGFDTPTQTFKERPDVFGDGVGTLILLGNGTATDISFSYSLVAYNALTNNYTFTLVPQLGAPASVPHTVRATSDAAALPALTGPAPGADVTVPPNSWNETVMFSVGASVITLRVPEAQARDITLPCDLALGIGEQPVLTGEYDATVANQIRALAGAPFASWMVGLFIDLGAATSTASAARRQIATYVNPTTITYSGANVPGTLAGGTRNAFRFTIDSFEVRTALNMVPGPHPDLKAFSLSAPTSRPHARLLAVPQIAVRIVPDVRNTNLQATSTPANPDVRDREILPAGSTVFSATYVDATQDAYFTPILLAQGSGKAYIDGLGPFAYTAVTDQPGPTLRFQLAAGTTQAFAAGTIVEIETTSLLDQFAIEFPDTWFAPIDAWLAGLGGELNKLEAKFCRLLSGSNQDIAASAAVLAGLATTLSLQLTLARFAIVAWLAPLAAANSLTRALDTLNGIGAARATQVLRAGGITEFASMAPGEGTHEGATLLVAQSYQQRVTTDEQYRVLSKAVGEVRARFDALTAAANAVGDIKAAQAAELERKQAGARRIEALQEKLP